MQTQAPPPRRTIDDLKEWIALYGRLSYQEWMAVWWYTAMRFYAVFMAGRARRVARQATQRPTQPLGSAGKATQPLCRPRWRSPIDGAGLTALLLLAIATLGVACYRVAALAATPAPPPAVAPLLTRAEPIVVFQTVLPTAAPTALPPPTPEPQIVYVDRVVERVVEVPVPAQPAPIVFPTDVPAPAEPPPANEATTAAVILSKLPFAAPTCAESIVDGSRPAGCPR